MALRQLLLGDLVMNIRQLFSRLRPSSVMRVQWMLCLGFLVGGAGLQQAQAVDLADGPLFTTTPVPGNLALALSVEWPTATTPAYPSTVTYSAGTAYLGYFDAEKCYKYSYNSTTPTSSYFAPFGAASNRTCTSTSTDPLWSGNYMNWAGMQTLDAFRWVLTGGYRSVDTTSMTVLTKTNALQDSGVMPDKFVTGSPSTFTPFGFSAIGTRLRAVGTSMYVTGVGMVECSFSTEATTLKDTYSCITPKGNKGCSKINGATTCTVSLGGGENLSCVRTTVGGKYTYTCNTLDSGSVVQTSCIASGVGINATDGSASSSCKVTPENYQAQSTAAGTASDLKVYRVYVSVQVCDATKGLESNCVAYGTTAAKPEGLMQANAGKLRYSAFGYYNHTGNTRDGGVMRARMKYIGPTKQVPGYPAEVNTLREWDSGTGIMVVNPDTSDATATTAFAAKAGWTVPITNSGVMNYLNKFGYTAAAYKGNDPVGELYYTALRYLKNLGRSGAVLLPEELHSRHRRRQHPPRQQSAGQQPAQQRRAQSAAHRGVR